MMKIDLRKRGEGKTTDLMKRSIETGFNMVVMNEIEKKRIQDIFLESNIKDYPEIFTFSDFIDRNKMRGKKIKSLLIDNAEHLLQSISKEISIDTITLSEEENFSEIIGEEEFSEIISEDKMRKIAISGFLLAMLFMVIFYYLTKFNIINLP